MWSILWITAIFAVHPLIIAKEGNTVRYGHTSFEFDTEKPFVFDVEIRDYVVLGMQNRMAIELSYTCSEPVLVFLQKCGRGFLYTNQTETNGKLFFQDDWLDYLMKVTYHKCNYKPDEKDDRSMSIRVNTRTKTHCRFVIRNVKKVELSYAIPKFKSVFNVKKEGGENKVYHTQIDFAALVKNKKIDIVTDIVDHIVVWLSKCDFIAPYNLRIGANLTETEDQVDLIRRMAVLTCSDDKTVSFLTHVSSRQPVSGKLSLKVMGAAEEDESTDLVDILIIVVLVVTFLAPFCVIGCCVLYSDSVRNHKEKPAVQNDTLLEMDNLA